MERNRSIIHKWAAVGGATAGALPIGPDAIVLAAEEVTMTIQVAAMFGVPLTKSAAEGVMASCCGSIIGTAVFEGLNVGYPVTIPVKVLAAVTTIEGVGNAVYSYYESKALS